MIQRSETDEAYAIAARVMQALVDFPNSGGLAAASMRVAVGIFLAKFYDYVTTKSVGTEMLGCFEAARLAGASVFSMDNVRASAMAEAPMHGLGVGVCNASIIFALAEQSKIIADTIFSRRIDADAMMDRMSATIEDIKVSRSNVFTVFDYQNTVALAALLINHLSATERDLPRVIAYHLKDNSPALTVANRIYSDGSRAEELIAENKVVHPAFMPRDIIALSQ